MLSIHHRKLFDGASMSFDVRDLKVSEKFPIKFSQSGKLTEVIDCWGFREVNILVRLGIIQT